LIGAKIIISQSKKIKNETGAQDRPLKEVIFDKEMTDKRDQTTCYKEAENAS
jgi:hypothetical protein